MRLLGLVSLLALLAAPVAQAVELQPGDILALGRADPVQNPGGENLLLVDSTTGDRTVISGCTNAACTTSVGSGPIWGSGFQDVSVGADGTVLVIGNDCLIQVDPSNGNRTLISSKMGTACANLGSGPFLTGRIAQVPLQAASVSAIGDWGTLVMAGMLALLMVRELRQRFGRA